MHDIFNWWKIAPYSYINDDEFRNTLYEYGYYVDKSLENSELNQLEELYKENHNFKVSGMFNTMYSKNIEYRKKMHHKITNVLENYLNKNYTNYKVVYSVFFLKGPSTQTFLFMHQDLSLVDEMKHSSIHLWIPLTDIGIDNGAVCIIDKSHHIYAPYRGMSFPDPANNIQQHISPYLKPILLKKGEILAFDPRTIHCSLPNKTKTTRPVVIVVLAPMEANIEVCYQNPIDKRIEIIRQEEDFFITSNHFIESSKERPTTGNSIGYVDYKPHYYTEQEFDILASKFKIEKKDIITRLGDMNTKIYRNPVSRGRNLFLKWFK